MKKINYLVFIGVFLLTTSIIFSGCKKKSSDATPTPPTFLVTAVPDPNDITKVFLHFKCNTDDITLTKIVITDPAASNIPPVDTGGAQFLKDIDYTFQNSITKESGTWKMQFVGNRVSDKSSFTATTSFTM